MKDLKPCPFCAELTAHTADCWVTIYVLNHQGGGHAAKAWNRRAPVEITDAMVARAYDVYGPAAKHLGPNESAAGHMRLLRDAIAAALNEPA